jgi:hypothetical protein
MVHTNGLIEPEFIDSSEEGKLWSDPFALRLKQDLTFKPEHMKIVKF